MDVYKLFNVLKNSEVDYLRGSRYTRTFTNSSTIGIVTELGPHDSRYLDRPIPNP